MSKYAFILTLLVCLAVFFGSTVSAQDSLPPLSELPAGEWTEIAPGGETLCAYGAPYRFAVRPAPQPSDKLMIFFQGGGACWNGENCAPDYESPFEGGGGIFKQTVDEGESQSYNQGIFDLTNAENPLADYNAVYVAYCSADIHTGSRDVEYDGYTTHFRGSINATAALDWTFANFESPSDVFISGCSAGSYGSIFHAPRIMSHYNDVQITQLGDAGIGVVARGWDGLETWGMYDNLADIPGYETIRERPNRINPLLYRYAAAAFPANEFAQYTTYLDSVQIGFYFLQGGGATPEEAGGNWLTGMRSNLNGLDGTVKNFYSYMAWGNSHCITDTPDFYTYQVNGMRFRDWVTDLIADDPVRDVACTACDAPELYTPQ